MEDQVVVSPGWLAAQLDGGGDALQDLIVLDCFTEISDIPTEPELGCIKGTKVWTPFLIKHMICFWLSSHFCAEFVVAGARCGTGSRHSVSTVLSGTVCSERYLCQWSVVCMVCKPPEMTCVKYFLVELYSLTHSFLDNLRPLSCSHE